MKKIPAIKSSTLGLLITSSMVISSFGALSVDIQGEIGSGSTIWTFNGDYVITDSAAAGELSSLSVTPSNLGINGFGHASGELSGEFAADSAYDNSIISVPIGGGLFSSGNGADPPSLHTLDGVFLDSDGSIGSDDFGWFATGSFTSGHTVTFTNTILVVNVDISTFGEGPTLITDNGDTFSVASSSEITPLTLTFTAVPEPSGVVLLGLGGLALVGIRRRL